MPLTPHDDYYHKVRQKAHDKMARVTGREADGDDELRCSLAHALKNGTPFAVTFEQSDADAFIARLRRC